MKAGIFFTGSGPIVFVTSHESFEDSGFIDKLVTKGLKKFIAYEVSINEVKEKYGQHFTLVMNDLKQADDLRVLDYDGHHVFNTFRLQSLGTPFYYEP